MSSESSGDREKETTQPHGSESSDADVEIEYVTEEPGIYEPNFIFKRIFEAFRLTDEVRREKEKEPEKLNKLENSAAPKKKGFEERSTRTAMMIAAMMNWKRSHKPLSCPRRSCAE